MSFFHLGNTTLLLVEALKYNFFKYIETTRHHICEKVELIQDSRGLTYQFGCLTQDGDLMKVFWHGINYLKWRLQRHKLGKTLKKSFQFTQLKHYGLDLLFTVGNETIP